jgi:hypothetical protein
MAQTASTQMRSPPVEHPCGRYKITQQGNSSTIGVPRQTPLDIASVIMRAGEYCGQAIYLKAIPDSGAETQGSETQTVISTDAGETIVEDFLGSYSVRDSGDDNALTIPSAHTDRFPKKTKPLIVAARSARGIDYLKIIPVCVWEKAESIAHDDLVRAEQTLSS